jgi:hypothetical protein
MLACAQHLSRYTGAIEVTAHFLGDSFYFVARGLLK